MNLDAAGSHQFFPAIGKRVREEKGGDGKWRLNSKHRFQVDMWRHQTMVSNISIWQYKKIISQFFGLEKTVTEMATGCLRMM